MRYYASMKVKDDEEHDILLKMFDLTGTDDFLDTFKNPSKLKKLKLGDYILVTNVKYHPPKAWSESISVSYLPDQKTGTCGFAVPVKHSEALKNALALTEVDAPDEDDIESCWKKAVSFVSPDPDSSDKLQILDGTVTAVTKVQNDFGQVLVRPVRKQSDSSDAATVLLSITGRAVRHVFGLPPSSDSEASLTGDDVKNAQSRALNRRFQFLLQPGQVFNKQAIDARPIEHPLS